MAEPTELLDLLTAHKFSFTHILVKKKFSLVLVIKAVLAWGLWWDLLRAINQWSGHVSESLQQNVNKRLRFSAEEIWLCHQASVWSSAAGCSGLIQVVLFGSGGALLLCFSTRGLFLIWKALSSLTSLMLIATVLFNFLLDWCYEILWYFCSLFLSFDLPWMECNRFETSL